MMKVLFSLLLTALLLCGCAAQNAPPAETASTVPATAVPPETAPAQPGFSMVPLSGNSPATAYSLPENVTGFLLLRDKLLFFSGHDSTTLTLLNSDSPEPAAVHEVPFALYAENATVQLLDMGLSYFDSTSGETVVLDNSLRELRRIPVQDDLTGMPLLSADGEKLYYCTASAVRVLELSTGISRILKEVSYPVQGLSGLLLDDTVLQLSITDADGSWQTLFLSSENGQLLHGAQGNLLPETSGDSYLLQTNESILFGQTGGNAMLLYPRQPDSDCFFLPDAYGAVTVSAAEGATVIEYYSLPTGSRTAELYIPGTVSPVTLVQATDETIWFLDTGEKPVLYRWNPVNSSIADNRSYSSPYYTRSEPDYEGLAACSLYAQELSTQYGLEILIYKDAAALEPWDYHLEYEHQASTLYRELETLNRHLKNFPAGFLKTLRDRFTALKICIVRSVTGSPESGSQDAVNGIQFMDGFDAYIVLATDQNTEYALYHELCHLMETVILTESVAYDRWDNLNPSDFRYDDDYVSNRTRDGSNWMKPGKEYFIDTYSMSFAKEDRARLFEYAMTAGHEDLFQSPNLQAKLRQLCTGIREGFGLERSEEAFLWEQYLEQ